MNAKTSKSDQAAHAAWLSYISGKTQDEVAKILGVSRPAVQRLLAHAAREGMVKIRIDHTSTQCLELGQRLCERFGLNLCRVVPAIPDVNSEPAGVSHKLAEEIERWLERSEPAVLGLGTGKTLRAAVGLLPRIDCDQHTIVSLTGNISPDGSVAKYNVSFSIADKLSALTYALPMPVVAATKAELKAIMAQRSIKRTMALAKKCDVAFVGIGELSDPAPILNQGFVSKAELDKLRAAGAVGDIIGWCYDDQGRILSGHTNARVASVPLKFKPGTNIIAAAKGPSKAAAIKGAIKGRLIHGLITDEKTAKALLRSG